ncbi:hypothetical protein [uncultured Tenacibaculum sp.]|uniref:hypothetical protein n=1 Tax=uncultured Tenacibaculum sp. TaxID=174713 RepID=UPI002626B067|nr:hypothetical protein [uncultured Tenacibaculum sp.]
MKKVFLTSLLLFQITSVFPQDKNELQIFENKNNWKKEVIKFPIEWAPKFKLTGFEELLFSPNWNKPKNHQFWSLVIGWKIDSKNPISLEEITTNFKGYFDGLMKPNHWAKDFPDPQVSLKNSKKGFIGSMTFFDGFHTGKIINVNIKGNQFFDPYLKQSIITFRISPKEYGNPIWDYLNEIKVKNNNTSIIKLDDSWGKEVFKFPIPFANNINYKGIAEVRFPPKGWRNPKHENFWSYVYAWHIDLDQKITKEELKTSLQQYFDGLNNIENNKHLSIYKAVVYLQNKGTSKNSTLYKGEINTYDRFATNTGLKLNVIIESTYCEISKKNLLLFKFSPKTFTHETWQMLDKINPAKNLCN